MVVLERRNLAGLMMNRIVMVLWRNPKYFITRWPMSLLNNKTRHTCMPQMFIVEYQEYRPAMDSYNMPQGGQSVDFTKLKAE